AIDFWRFAANIADRKRNWPHRVWTEKKKFDRAIAKCRSFFEGGRVMDVTSSTVQLNTQDGKMDAYVAQPKESGKYPGIVVIQEAFGINSHIKKVTDRIAAEGYIAIAPDIFHRESERLIPYSDMPKAIATMQRVVDSKAMEDVGAAIAHLKSQSTVKSDAIGVIGFCLGRRLTYLAAAHHTKDVKAAVPYYGGRIFIGKYTAPFPARGNKNTIDFFFVAQEPDL